MATKTITIMEDAYELLKKAKEPGESFSDTIRRTYEKKDMRAFFGIWDKEFADSVEQTVKEMRTGRSERMERVINDMS